MGDFVHLHLHSEYSLLDGACRIGEIAAKAKAEGHDAVAITDHGVMYGAVDFYRALKAEGLHPIIGCEVYVAARSRHHKDGKADSSGNHLVLLCKNDVGYRNLCYMVSMSFIEGFYMRPRIDMELLRRHHEGLVALSGCLAGRIPRSILAGDMQGAEAYALELKELFGEDFYLEIQNHHLDDEKKVAYGCKLIGEKLHIPLVATNDVHYLEKSDADIQKTLMCIQTGKTVAEGAGFGFETDEFYYRSTEEMRALFSMYKGAVENTVVIGEKCKFDFTFGELYLPTFTPRDGLTHEQTLRRDAALGLQRRIERGNIRPGIHTLEEYTDRMEYELSVIHQMGFDAYFLIVADFVNYAKDSDIPVGPGRGSGAGSLVAYCIGITDVDPIAFDLLFERFLNPERVSMPDFDIDFSDERRDEVIAYVKRKYGEDKVSQIVTFGTLAARAAIKDVGRALGMPYAAVNTVAGMIPRVLNITIDAALKNKELKALYDTDPEIKKLIDISRRLEGMPRHASTHAAGVVMTEKPTYTYVPLADSGNGTVIQFDMNTAAKLGLVKFDFLGLRNLSVIHAAQVLIRRKCKDFDITTVPFDDKATYALLCSGRTDGVFQLEKGGMKQVLMRLAPKSLEDIIACIALYRPGPMDSIDTFIERKHGRQRIEYKIPALARILDVTYGCIVYQEQVMQIFRELAGYSYAEADIVRRAMAKKDEKQMLAERERFLKGARERGIEGAAAEEIFMDMFGFASYAFNKSHATAYAFLSYRTAYLKAHYPAEYFAALMSSVLSATDKLRTYIADAQKYGVRVLPPDINASDADFSVSESNIRFGLLAVRGVGRPFAAAVTQERQKRPYTSFDEFVSRQKRADLNRKTLESLIKCGAFDSLGVPRSALLASYEAIIDTQYDRQRNNVAGQMDLFSMASGTEEELAYQYPSIPEYSPRELLLLEKESSGMYFSGHMADSYAKHMDALAPDRIGDILTAIREPEEELSEKYRDRAKVKIAGLINQKKTKTLNNGNTMAFLRVEDKYGEIEVIVFARQYASVAAELTEERAVCIEGTLSIEERDEQGAEPKILFSSFIPLQSNSEYMRSEKERSAAENTAATESRLYIKLPELNDRRLSSLERLCSLYPGKTAVVLYGIQEGKYVRYKGLSVTVNESSLPRLQSLFGGENVVYRG